MKDFWLQSQRIKAGLITGVSLDEHGKTLRFFTDDEVTTAIVVPPNLPIPELRKDYLVIIFDSFIVVGGEAFEKWVLTDFDPYDNPAGLPDDTPPENGEL